MRLTWNKLNRLAAQHGDSFYILDLNRFRKNFTELEGEFRRRYPKTRIAYSYKTNYIPHLCALVNRLGGYAEVVSRSEYELARRVGVAPKNIIFNGPKKSSEDLLRVFRSGGMVNLDSLYECELLRSIAGRHPGLELRVGLRCNFPLPGVARSHFGFDVESSDWLQAVETIGSLKNGSITGIQCHFSSAGRDARSYAFRTNAMLSIMDRFFPGKTLRYIDIGGGFFGDIDPILKKQWPCKVPSFREYAQAVASPLLRRFRNESAAPELILEPGIALAGNVVQYVTRVLGTKTIARRRIAVMAGSAMHLKPTLHGKNMPLRIVPDPTRKRSQPGSAEPHDLVGSTCMEKDVLQTGYTGEIGEGDFAVFSQAGGYTVVLAPPFIAPFPAILAAGSSRDEIIVARRPGEFRDMFAGFNFKWKPAQ